MAAPVIRDAAPADIAALAQLWFDAWQDAHAAILPAAWTRARTVGSFAERLRDGLERVRATEEEGSLLGFSMVKGDELDQFFLAAGARGTGLAPILIADALDRLRAGGTTTAWLACAVGNMRAARFYEKQGWRRGAIIRREIDTPEGPVGADMWRYEIDL
jgi:GNAT superfamily N-acetyltransferase